MCQLGKQMTLEMFRQQLQEDSFCAGFAKLYGKSTEILTHQKMRYLQALQQFSNVFGDHGEIAMYTAPGRIEVGGNHTDHQHGCVLAAAINQDLIAVVRPNQSNVIRLQSEGYPMQEVDLSDLSVQAEELQTTASLIRGVAAGFAARGFCVQGFDAYVTSEVAKGSGLSSSAAFEVLIGRIINHEFCDGAMDDIAIAQISQFAENKYFGKPSGLMDQMASSVGGFVAIDFRNPEQPQIQQIPIDFATLGYAVCVVDARADHADLTDEYAAIPQEMKAVAQIFGCSVLREVDEAEFLQNIPRVRETAGDRAVLRAMHFFEENRRAQQEANALRERDIERFFELVIASGRSSFMYNQNVYCNANPQQQALSIALAVSEQMLTGKGAWRVHGGGFGGTILAFVPTDLVAEYTDRMNGIFGEDSCHVLTIRGN